MNGKQTKEDIELVTPEEAAFHEAGHIAMAKEFGKFVSEVSIWDTGEGWVGDAQSSPPTDPKRQFAVRSAGLIAIVLLRGTLKQKDLIGAGVGVTPDNRKKGDAARAGKLNCQDSGEAWKLAVDALRSNWGFVCKLAAALPEAEIVTEFGVPRHMVEGGEVKQMWGSRQHVAPPNVTDALEEARVAFRDEAANE